MPQAKIQTIHQLLQKKDFRQAIDLAGNLYAQYSNNFEVVLCYGVVAMSAGDAVNAKDLFAFACQLNPQSFDAQYNFALSLQKTNDWQLAIKAYQRADKIRSANLSVLANMALCFEQLLQWPQAQSIYDQILTKHPNNTQVLNNLANLYRGKKEYQLSKSTFIKLLSLAPEDSNGLKNYAHLLSEMTDYQQAIAHYSLLQKRHPNDLQIVLWIADNYFKMLELDQAESSYQQVLKQSPEMTRALFGMANVLVKRGEFRDAENYSKKAISKNPTDPSSIYTHAMVLSQHTAAKKLEQSKQLLGDLIGQYSDHSLAFDCLSKVFVKLGNPQAAIQPAKRACEIEPTNIDYKMTLQDAFNHAGKLLEAEKTLQQIVDRQIIEKQLDFTDAFRQLGIVQLRLEKPENALKALKVAVDNNPRDQRSLSHYVIALQATQQLELAKKMQSFEQLIFDDFIKPSKPFSSLEEFNAALEQEIKAHPTLKWEPNGLATKGGYMTEDLTDAKTPALSCLVTLINRKIEQYRIELPNIEHHPFLGMKPQQFKLHMWAVLLEGKGHVGPHIHEDSWISGAYYAKLPAIGNGKAKDKEPDNYEGWIEFGQAHQEIPYTFPEQNHQIQPQAGKLVLFPSYYFHQTIPYFDTNERISIAFDVEAIS